MAEERSRGTKRAAQLERAHAELTEAYQAIVASDGWVAYLEMMAMLPSYSPGNVARIMAARPSATMVASLTTWNRLGRTVRKGERGIGIVVPRRRKRDEDDPGSLAGFGIGYCFDVSQTEGDPLPEAARPELATGHVDDTLMDRVVALIERHGFTVRRAPLESANGETRFVSKQVVLGDHLVGRGSLKTALHELAHVLLHEGDRSDQAKKEVEAESVAWLCVRQLLGPAGGDEVLAYSGPYLAHWAKGDPDLVARTASVVRTTAAKIVEALEQTDGTEERPSAATVGPGDDGAVAADGRGTVHDASAR